MNTTYYIFFMDDYFNKSGDKADVFELNKG